MESVKKFPVAHVIGLVSIVVVAVGVWGLAGWPWAVITIGLPPASFYLVGEAYAAARAARGPRTLEEED